MHSHEEHIGRSAKAIIDKTVLPNLNEQLNTLDRFLDSYEEISATYNSKVVKIKEEAGLLPVVLETLSFRQNVFDLFEKHRVYINPNSFEKEFESYRKEFLTFIESLPEDQKVEQSSELFSLKVVRPEGMRFLIVLKRLLWRITSIPNGLLNLSRALFGKKKKPARYWNHKIPWKRMTKLHLEDNFGIDILTVYEQLFRLESQILLSMSPIGEQVDQAFLVEDEEEITKEVEPAISKNNDDVEKPANKIPEDGKESAEPEVQTIEKIEMAVEEKESKFRQIQVYYRDKLDELRMAISEFRDTLPEKIVHRYDKAYETFSENTLIVGTVELPLFNYRSSLIETRSKSFERQYQRLKELWEPTLDSIWDTKLYKLEIKMLRYFATKEYFRLERTYRQRINSNIIGELDKLHNFILDSKNRFTAFEGDEEGLRKLLREEKINVKKTLTNQLTPKTVDFIMNQELPNLLHQTEQILKRRVEQLATSRSLSPDEHEHLPILKSEKVNLRQMVAFEALPHYSKESKNIRTKIFEDLNKIQSYIIDINQIVDFTLESSLAANSSEGDENENPKIIAEEGLERALSRTGDVHNELHDIIGEVNKNFKASVLKFNDDLTNLLNVSDITQIKARISKAMTLSKTVEMRKNVMRFFMNLGPFTLLLVRSQFKKAKAWFDTQLQRFGLAQSPEIISTEIADFLAATKSAVAKLPFVYQRLFKLEPLSDGHFFLAREKEMKEIGNAFENWKMDHYASTVVVGERGSGVTTLLHHFLDSIKGIRVIKGEVHETCYSPSDFQNFLNDLLDTPELNNIEETIAMLNKSDAQRVIVLEDLQHLFLKVVDGFSALTNLLEIISKTNGKVFWLMSCTSQAWSFLCKTIKFNEYLAYVIPMAELPDEEIFETIWKRHRVSGYDEKFLASERVIKSKKYKRIPTDGQQEYLKKEYFSRLSDFAKSNISLAILFWLRSTQKVEGNTIHIGIEEPDFNFLNALTTSKLLIIYLILLHNGLNEDDLAKIQNIPVERARLELINLLDDGILEKESDNYEINMFLYRPLLRLLREKNIIH